jgi:hypothetical protein
MVKVDPGEKVLPAALKPSLIAPCGMNCGLCVGYLRRRNTCGGCRSGDEGKARSVLACTTRTCEKVVTGGSGSCSDCERIPCPRLRRLDARYRQKYRMSMLENLEAMRERGVEAFLEAERERWARPACGGVQCVHTAECIYCGQVWP